MIAVLLTVGLTDDQTGGRLTASRLMQHSRIGHEVCDSPYRNLGPVKSADITLRPLTLLIGPNNSGKSLVATAMYAALAGGRISLPLQLIRANRRQQRLEDDLEPTLVSALLDLVSPPDGRP